MWRSSKFKNDPINKGVCFLSILNSYLSSDGPFLQKLAKFETCNAPSDGTATRKTYKLTSSNGQQGDDRSKLIELLSSKLSKQFEDTQ